MSIKLIPLKQLSHLVAQFVLGQELGLCLALLRIIAQALGNPKIGDVARFVYAQLPARLRSPLGPVSEPEFVDLVLAGQSFLSKVRAALRP
jgi:hypothetical protein